MAYCRGCGERGVKKHHIYCQPCKRRSDKISVDLYPIRRERTAAFGSLGEAIERLKYLRSQTDDSFKERIVNLSTRRRPYCRVHGRPVGDCPAYRCRKDHERWLDDQLRIT